MSTFMLSSKRTRRVLLYGGRIPRNFSGTRGRVALEIETYPQLDEPLVAGAGGRVRGRYDDVSKGIDLGGSIQIRDVQRVDYVGRFSGEFEALVLVERK